MRLCQPSAIRDLDPFAFFEQRENCVLLANTLIVVTGTVRVRAADDHHRCPRGRSADGRRERSGRRQNACNQDRKWKSVYGNFPFRLSMTVCSDCGVEQAEKCDKISLACRGERWSGVEPHQTSSARRR